MARSTSIVLGDHFDKFVAALIENGRYDNATDVIRSGLRLLEEHERKLTAQRDALKGENSGPDRLLDMEAIIRSSRAKAGLDG